MPQLNIEAKTALALQVPQRNLYLTLNRAAAIYEVPRARLRRRLTGIPSRADWVPKQRELSDLEK